MDININEKYLEKVFETQTDYTEWFGYYNYDVLSKNCTKMLCGRTNFEARAITPEDTVQLGYYDLNTKSWVYIGASDSFNWQQGAMLQWLPGEGNQNKVIYNYSDKKKFYSRIVDIQTGEQTSIDYPIYCITPDGRFAITLNYERSYWCRAYHYQSVINEKYDVQIDEEDGIFKVDLVNNAVERIISIKDVIALDADDDFDNAKHWLEHIMINPAGTRFVFLHRFTYGMGYITRLCIADIDGKNLQVVKGWRVNDWSHFGWKGNDEFVIYSVKKSFSQAKYVKSIQKGEQKLSLRRIVSKISNLPLLKQIKNALRAKQSNQYYLVFKYEGDEWKEAGKYDHVLLNIDGHPSFTKDGKYMITDSYPDKKGFQRLIAYNTLNNKAVLLGEFYAPLKGNPASCDLHPKFNASNEYIVVDTACSGKHKMIVFRLNDENIKRVLE